ncbi:hypothetical protein M9H77_04738 [Catharanthus roseus]|uniref:Uncharacterized protein n=1 Tax=Catharanthus roseus TaxID=4058 RepID=A0ACC0CF05_CATRO|nr:hypothetical protein M9H77_04738 [Catharanthus roseus]
MQGRNTVEEVLRLSAERGYTIFHRNREDSNVLSDIVVAHPTLIAMIRTWPYVLIMDKTYKTNKYNMPLLECVGMTLTGKNFAVATAFMCNEQATTYICFLQQIKHLYFTSAMSNGQGSVINEGEPLVILTDRESGLMQGLYLLSVVFWDRDNEPGRERTFSVESVAINMSRKIGKSSGSGSGSSSGSGSGFNPNPRGRGRSPRSGRGRGRGLSSGRSSLSFVVCPDSPSAPFPFNNAFPGFMYQFIQNWKNVVGDGNCGFRVVSNFLFEDENHLVEIRRRMSYDLRHRMNIYEQLFGSVERVTELIMKTNWEESSAPPEYWMDTHDYLYVIANTFNLCVVFLARSESTIVLPLVSNMDGPAETISIGLIEELQHFIQLQLVDGCPLLPLQVQLDYHRDIRVSGWRPHIVMEWQIGLRDTVKCICHRDILCNNVAICNL